jgi:putative ABC transport system permease protein
MRSLLLQVIAVTSINLRSMGQRRWLSLSTVIAVALVVIVLLAFLAMANGFQRTIAGSGRARRRKSTARWRAIRCA